MKQRERRHRKGEVGMEAEPVGWSRKAQRRKRTGHGDECQNMYCKYLSIRSKTTYQIFSRELSFTQLAQICFYSFSSGPEVPSPPTLCFLFLECFYLILSLLDVLLQGSALGYLFQKAFPESPDAGVGNLCAHDPLHGPFLEHFPFHPHNLLTRLPLLVDSEFSWDRGHV